MNTTLGRVLTMSLALAACTRERKTEQPSLAGFSLGATWQTTGQSLPCHSVPTSYEERLDAGLHTHTKWCEPADSVTLLFSSDTLIAIRVRVAQGREQPEAIWRDRLDHSLAPLLGAPDSVTTNFEPQAWSDLQQVRRSAPCPTCLPVPAQRTLTAVWRCKPDRLWYADVWLSGSDSLSLPFTRVGPIGLPPSSSGSVSLTTCRVGAPSSPTR